MTHIRLGYFKTLCGLNSAKVFTAAEVKDATCEACKAAARQMGTD